MKTSGRFILYQFLILLLLIAASLLNEAVNLSHYVFDIPPLLGIQRIGEVLMESCIALFVVIIEAIFIIKLRRDIRILEGFLPICANCKKIRKFDHWVPLEKYISDHSMARFSHAICPECLGKLYPDLARETQLNKTAATGAGQKPPM